MLHHSCGYCEREFGLPNIGAGHGICERHKEEMLKQAGLGQRYKENPNNATIDLRTVDPEDLKIAAYFTVLMQKKMKKNWNTPKLAAA